MVEELMVAASPRRAFVTGATGGIGSVLCARLSEEGSQVIALARAGSDASSIENRDGVAIVRADILDEPALTEAMRGCDAVFHLAATVHAPAGTPDSEFRRVNVAGTEAVLRSATAAGVSAGVFFSTLRTVRRSSSIMMTNPRPPNSPFVWSFISR